MAIKLEAYKLGWNWLGGYFDGEGSIYRYVDRRVKYLTVRMQVSSTKLVSLKACKEISGVGYINLRTVCHNKNSAPVWQWIISRTDDCAPFLHILIPRLIEKQTQAIIAYWWLHNKSDLRSLELLSVLNRRGKEGHSLTTNRELAEINERRVLGVNLWERMRSERGPEYCTEPDCPELEAALLEGRAIA